MTKVLISGSRSITELPLAAIESINRIMELKFQIIIGDADGVDNLVQKYLREKEYGRVHVFYAKFNGSGRSRNTNKFTAFGIKGNYSDRDKRMCEIADYGLAIWDGKSRGTKANIDRVPKTKVILV